MTLEWYFDELDRKLCAIELVQRTVESVLADVVTRLKAEVPVEDVFLTGSLVAGTAVAGYSDLDVFVQLPECQLHPNSTKALVKMYNSAQAAGLPVLSLDAPAIVVKHPRLPHNIDIVPAFQGEGNGQTLMMPGFDGQWIKATPKGHGELIRQADTRSAGRLRPLIRFLKAWKYGNKIPVISFYLECMAYWFSQQTTTISYSEAIEHIIIQFVADMLQHKESVTVANPLHPHWGPVAPFALQNRGIAFQKIVNNVPYLKAGNELAADGETERATLVWNKAFGA